MNVKVNRQKILDIIRENRSNHEKEYRKACEVYWDDTRNDITSIQKKINELLAQKATTISDLVSLNSKVYSISKEIMNIRIPEQHLDDYDRVIRMLELSVDEDISLNENQFENYVQDKWDWSHSFLSNTLSYSSKFKSV